MFLLRYSMHIFTFMIIVKIYIIWIPKRYQVRNTFFNRYDEPYVGIVCTYNYWQFNKILYVCLLTHVYCKKRVQISRLRRPLIKFTTWIRFSMSHAKNERIVDPKRVCDVLLGICIIHDIFNLNIIWALLWCRGEMNIKYARWSLVRASACFYLIKTFAILALHYSRVLREFAVLSIRIEEFPRWNAWQFDAMTWNFSSAMGKNICAELNGWGNGWM